MDTGIFSLVVGGRKVGANNEQARFNFGDLLHLLEIAALLIAIGVNYEKFEETSKQVEFHSQSLNRIEHYLSSKDREYWRLSKDAQ